MVGLPKSIIKRYGITKKAWSVFRGRRSSSRKGKTRGIKMARRRRYFPRFRRYRRGSTTIPIAPVMGFVAATNAYGAWDSFQSGNFNDGVEKVMAGLTGFSTRDGSFDFSRMRHGLLPIIIGFLVHWVCGKIGVNRALGRAKIPVVRI